MSAKTTLGPRTWLWEVPEIVLLVVTGLNMQLFLDLGSSQSGRKSEVKTTETNMHKQHTGSVGLWPAGSWERSYRETSSQWTVTMATLLCHLLKLVLRSDYKHLIKDLFNQCMYIQCLKMAFMHLMQLFLFNYVPFSISVHMTHRPTEHLHIQPVFSPGHLTHIHHFRSSQL